MQFWEAIDYKSSRKVLVIPNITNSSNIEKDSFIDVLYNHIKGLEKYGDYFWNVLVPKGNVTKKLNLPNVKQHEIDIPGDMMNHPPKVQCGRANRDRASRVNGRNRSVLRCSKIVRPVNRSQFGRRVDGGSARVQVGRRYPA